MKPISAIREFQGKVDEASATLTRTGDEVTAAVETARDAFAILSLGVVLALALATWAVLSVRD